MIRLDNTNRSLAISLAGATTTNAVQVVVSYADDTGSTYQGGTTTSTISGTSKITICAAPASSTIRTIDSIIVYNADTVAASVNVLFDDNGTYFQLSGSTLQVADTLQFTHARGWETSDVNGSIKTSLYTQNNATVITGTPALPNGVTATTQTAFNDSTLVATTQYVDSAVAAYSAMTTTIQQVTVNIGTQPTNSGSFTITGSGFTPGAPIMIMQAATRPNSVLYDNVEMDQIMVTGIATSSTNIQCNWGCDSYICNSYTFNYWI